MMPTHGGVARNWQIVGLTPDNCVVKRVNGGFHTSEDRPSDYAGIEYLTPEEYAILRRGRTAAGEDLEAPKA